MSPQETLKQAVKNARAYTDYFAGRAARNAMTAVAPVNPNKVFVMTFQRTLACNPRYIVDELLRRYPDVEVVVAGTGEPLAEYAEVENIRWVFRRSVQHFYEQATSRVWIDNANDCSWFPMMKKDNQLYLQTWHGSLGLKMIDAQNQTARWLRNMSYAAPITDFLLSNSDFEDWVFRTTYWPDTPILRTGHARNDLFFDTDAVAKAREKAFRGLSIDPSTHLALYAPTFREQSQYSLADVDFEGIAHSLERRFGGTWKIAVRSHFRGKLDTRSLADQLPCVVSATDYPDIQELMAASDVGITDYSSWICDYALTGRPGFLLVPDLDEYAEHDRGFYYPLESTPFPVCRTSSDLCQAIETLDEELYENRTHAYLKALGCIEDGHASERAADLIGEVLGSDAPIDLSQSSLVKELLSTN